MLTSVKINSLETRTKPYKIWDGEGLFLLVKPSGSKFWRFRYRLGKEKSISFGRYPDVSLKDARERRREAQGLLNQGLDPALERQRAKRATIRTHDNSFKKIAKEWYASNSHRWTDRHAKKLWRVIELHLLPELGREPVASIGPRDLLRSLRKLEAKGATETSHRAFWIVRRIFNYAVAIEAITHNPAASLGDALVAHKPSGHPCIPVEELPEFMRRLEIAECPPSDKLALRLLLLTALRTGELRRCQWTFVNTFTAELRIPKELMKIKSGAPFHIVPLSRQALAALCDLHELSGHQPWLFPNRSGWKPHISENVVNNLIAKMGYKGRMVGHSCRKLFSTVLNEHEFNADAIERQLDHSERRKSRAAYNHARHLQTRRQLMQWWADYLDSLNCGRFANRQGMGASLLQLSHEVVSESKAS